MDKKDHALLFPFCGLIDIKVLCAIQGCELNISTNFAVLGEFTFEGKDLGSIMPTIAAREPIDTS